MEEQRKRRFCSGMGLGVPCLRFLVALLMSFAKFDVVGSLANAPEDKSCNKTGSATPHGSIPQPADSKYRELMSFNRSRSLLARPELKLLQNMPQADIVTPIATVPLINPSNPKATITPMGTTSTSGQSWCIATESASQPALQVALDYACGYGGADCSQIQSSGSCYDPDTVRDHASYAFNSFFQRNPIPSSCDFEGTAILTSIDPSTSTCQYPSTSISTSILNTTNPVGSTIYRPIPPNSSGRYPLLRALPLSFTFLCILI
ncbi:hypothetical protein HPP92_024730 [Vanilla planifolia]|uniref:X8 domain-containing protein n=1 Tax=Vanilla planifolia TaxID=51239 RepID=A0A835UBS5_VANPL|nr:hypothetical protein HPP92_024730 [Vanilla planifolia]